MDELIKAINNVSEACNNSLPLWVSVVNIIVPILLTIVTIILSVRMDRQNKGLQKELSNRDMANQTRGNILDFYNSFYKGLNVVLQAKENVAEVFISEQSFYKWAIEIESVNTEILRSFNQAKLMLDDKEILGQMRSAKEEFSRLYTAVSYYVSSGIPSQTILNAWNEFKKQYDIQVGDYYKLLLNSEQKEAFVILCKNSYTINIESLIQRYIDVVGSNNFDEPFKKYVQIKKL